MVAAPSSWPWPTSAARCPLPTCGSHWSAVWRRPPSEPVHSVGKGTTSILASFGMSKFAPCAALAPVACAASARTAVLDVRRGVHSHCTRGHPHADGCVVCIAPDPSPRTAARSTSVRACIQPAVLFGRTSSFCVVVQTEACASATCPELSAEPLAARAEVEWNPALGFAAAHGTRHSLNVKFEFEPAPVQSSTAPLHLLLSLTRDGCCRCCCERERGGC